MKNNIILLICFFLTFSSVSCFAVEKNIIDESNKVMLKIYEDIIQQQKNYSELSQFNRDAITKNNHGIYSLEYQHLSNDQMTIDYSFAVTILNMTDVNPYKNDPANFGLGMPLLGVKFVGFQQSTGKENFDIMSSIKKFGSELWEYQQELLPIRLRLIALKDTFKIGEQIEFLVTLENTDNRAWRVKDLSYETMYFMMDDLRWGTEASRPEKVSDIVLEPKKKIRKKFFASGIDQVKEVEIIGSYNMTFKGVNPSDRLIINIVAE